jgi:hypothetical protein
MSDPTRNPTTVGPEHDFDFLFGTWRVHNRRLKGRLVGSSEWEDFDARCVARPIWGGAGNIDEFVGRSPSGPLRGMTLRLFDPASGQWRLHWANADRGILDQPMVGRFSDGRGEFYDQELFNGRAIFVRFVWSDISPTSARWEQAFSEDGGRTWETNWTMGMSRIE